MNEIDSDLDIDSINSSNILADNKRTSYTPTSNDEKHQSGSILRHVIFQGVTAQISSASVCHIYIIKCHEFLLTYCQFTYIF